MPKYFDIHSHLNFADFDKNRDEVLKNLEIENVYTVAVGTTFGTSELAVNLAQKNKNVFAAVGLHPVHTDATYYDAMEFGDIANEGLMAGEAIDFEKFKSLASHPKVVAIGECGLDYFRLEEKTKKLQFEAFEKQIELANQLGKSLMLHIRPNKLNQDAYVDALAILKSSNNKMNADSHFFAGNLETAKLYLDAGMYLSFTGVITFTRDYDEVIEYCPLDKLMSETDAPYVAPTPYRGKQNQPAYVIEVVKKIAEIKSLEFETVREQLVKNAMKFFGLGSLNK